MHFKISPKVGRLNRNSGQTAEFDAICWKFQSVFQKMEKHYSILMHLKLKLFLFSCVYGKNWALKCVPKFAVWFKNSLKIITIVYG